MKKQFTYEPYFGKGSIVSDQNGITRHAFFFDYLSLGDDMRENLLDEIEFASCENVREVIDEMTPIAVFYEDFYTTNKFGDTLSLDIVLSEDVRPSGHLDLLMRNNETGKIVIVEDGMLADFTVSDTEMGIRSLD